VSDAFGTDRPEARELAQLLHDLRAAAKLSTTDLGKKLKWSQSKVSRIDRGVQPVNVKDATRWGRATDATTAQLETLTRLATEAAVHHTNWTTHYRNRNPADGQRDTARQEAATTRLRVWAPALIPGALQTRATAARIYDAAFPGRDATREEWIDARLARASVLYDPGRRFEYLIGEPALNWWTGPTGDHLEQLDRVTATLTIPTIRLGIVPLGHLGDNPIQHTAGFNIYAERTAGHLPMVHVELKGDSLYGEDDLERYNATWEQLAEVALFNDRARDFLERVRADLRT
jgi:transcriptional regulator with XRE-family HTH domain